MRTNKLILFFVTSFILAGCAAEPTTANTPMPSATNTSMPTVTNTAVPTAKNTPTAITTFGTMVSDVDGMTLVNVPAGEFEMGSEDGDEDESPVHTVWLDEYWIDQTEVTNALYQQCVESGSCDPPAAWYYHGDNLYRDYPVRLVRWYDARDYCEWAGRRLPTEAEWEKAARGGLEGMKYSWGNEAPVCTKDAENGASFGLPDGSDTMEVGSFAPNGYGIYDMAGNVWEWVADWYGEDYYKRSPYENPNGPLDGDLRVLRGGGWLNVSLLRVADRVSFGPVNRFEFLGFRCALSPQQ